MNTNQEIKDLIKDIKIHRCKIPYYKTYWFTSGTSTHIVKYVIPIGNPKKESRFKKILLSLFSIFTIYKSK